MNFQQSYLYWLAGLILLIVALMSFRDKANPRRITTGLFWGIYGLLFLLGTWTYDLVGDKRTVHITSARPKSARPARSAWAIACSYRRWPFRW